VSLRLYMDHHVPGAITRGLRARGLDVLTAAEDGARQVPDVQLLDRATTLGRVLVTQDDDLLAEAARRQREGTAFAGLIYGHQLRVRVGQTIDDLELICGVYEPEEYAARVEYLPLK
jgi:hypothetical protein